MKKIALVASLAALTCTMALADDPGPGLRGQLSEAQERRLREQAENWRRNGRSDRAEEIERRLAEEDWADEMEEHGRRVRRWQEERQREWEAATGSPFVRSGERRPPECPPDPEKVVPPRAEPRPPVQQPPAPPMGPPRGGDRWGDYWPEEGRGSNDAGGILDLFR